MTLQLRGQTLTRAPAEPAARVTQDKYGEREGNCLTACVASLLGLRLEDCRELDPRPQDEGWQRVLQDFLGRRGLCWIETPAKGYPHYWKPSPLCILIGGSPRLPAPYQHCVIGRIRGYSPEIIHDPHPDRTGLTEIEAFAFLVPLTPAPIERLMTLVDSLHPASRHFPTGDERLLQLIAADMRAAAAEPLPRVEDSAIDA